MHRRSRFAILAVLLVVNSIFAAGKVQFNQQIRPLLSDRCYACHGPDEKNRKAKLRLDVKEGALGKSDENWIIKAGSPDESELFRRISSSDPDEKMPPPDSNLVLTPSEIGTIREWIAQGAEWQGHWAFIPPAEVNPPKVQKAGAESSEIDRFILARLQQEGLQPAPPAEKANLLRRVTFDLTGLPPTLEELDDFLADDSENAYEKVVDRLLASQAYGERMTTDWLDLARYSDTHGYQADRYRAMWPWRDWVIKAFNNNMPYDQFATEQLAGDLLPNPTKEQILATAFNRHHMQTEEGGSVEEEFRVSYVVDRVDTMGTAFLGLTFECSRCHDHKFDPISQKEFYQLFAFFNNIDESGQTSYFTDSMPVPTLLLSSDSQDRDLAALKKQISEKEQQLPSLKANLRPAFDQWLKSKPKEPAISGLIGSFDFNELKENKAANSANGSRPASAVESPQIVEGGHEGNAARLNGENGFTFNGLGDFSRSDPFSISIWVKTPALPKRAVVFHRSMAALDAASRGYEMVLEDGKPALGLHHMWPGNAIKVRGKKPLPTNEWTHLVMTYDGSSRAAGLALYINSEKQDLEIIRDNLWKDITYERGNPELTIGYRFRDNGFRDGVVDDFKIYNRELCQVEVDELNGRHTLAKFLGDEDLTDAGQNSLFDYYLRNFDPLYEKFLENLASLRKQQSSLINPIPEVMAMREMPNPRPAYILKRGAYDARGEEVTMSTPAAVAPFDSKYPRNRLGLAQWLFAPENPLTARVTVNRLWQMMFGRGIVATSDNFGSQGDLPTHPELLDWLANDFRDQGWDIKRMLKQIAMSNTYRQSSRGAPESLARDPENKLLARGPSGRLSAEMIRDNALAASGLLVNKIGGPPVKPYQPEGIWEEKSGARYERDKGEGLYRRSLYTFWKRTSPPPPMIAFDAAERNVCIVRRQVTSTPLQALVLLNDPQLVEASRFLAQRMVREGGSDIDGQLAWLFRLLTSDKPSDQELSVLHSMLLEQEDHYQSHPQDALALLTVGEKLNDAAFKPAHLAARTVVALALLNYDATLIKR